MREDQIAYDASKSSAHGCLSVEERKATTKLEACVEEREIGDGDRIKAGYASQYMLLCYFESRTFKTADEDPQGIQLPPMTHPRMKSGTHAPEQQQIALANLPRELTTGSTREPRAR
ncbi:hypothetical protein EON65_50565 [archaeon]|nr:MAG: hypothetical protein EON65_50565 [archaeon]